MKLAYPVALISTLLPLVSGLGIFITWLVTRWDWLMLAGVLNIYAGILLSIVAIIALSWFCWTRWRVSSRPQSPHWVQVIFIAGLLIVNYAVTAGVVAAVISIETRYTVVVTNASTTPLTDVQVFGGGVNVAIGTIAPGARVRRSLRFQEDGELRYSALNGSTTHERTIEGYVTSNMGGKTEITVTPDGEILVVR